MRNEIIISISKGSRPSRKREQSPAPVELPCSGLPGRLKWRYQLKPAPPMTLFSLLLKAPPSDTLARLLMARW